MTTLIEKELDFKLIPVDLSKNEQKDPTFLQKNPFGMIPVLDDNGFQIFESRAICRYLEMKYKEKGIPLIPTTINELAYFEQGVSMETSYWDPNTGGLAYEFVFKPKWGKGVPDQRRVND